MSLNDTVLEGSSDFFKQQTNRGKSMTPKRNTVDVALICHKHDYTYDEPGRVRSGNWKIGEHKRKDLIGSTVVLSETQSTPAYIGGKIIGVNPTWGGRVELIFKEDKALVGNTEAVSHPNWGQEKCYIV